jgi:hypothetical protein
MNMYYVPPCGGWQVSLETAGNGKDDALKGVKVALDWTVMGVERRKILKMLPKMGATVVDAGQERDVTVRAFGEGEVEGEEEGEVVGALWVSACWKEGKRVKVAGLEGVMEQALRPRKEREIEGCRRVVACISGERGTRINQWHLVMVAASFVIGLKRHAPPASRSAI